MPPIQTWAGLLVWPSNVGYVEPWCYFRGYNGLLGVCLTDFPSNNDCIVLEPTPHERASSMTLMIF